MSAINLGKGLLIIVGLAVVFIVVVYRSDIKKAYGRLNSFQYAEAQTKYGKMTYTDNGKGLPVLLIHGICGGYDQALASFEDLFNDKYRIIAPARFGYLGSDLPKDPSPINQAEAYKDLLDQLGIEKAIVFGTSAGSGSAIQFAIRHPDKTTALILISATAPVLPGVKLMSSPPSFVYTDFVMWAMSHTAKSFFLTLFGVDKAEFAASPESERAAFNRMFDTILPMGPRRAGTLNDNRVTNLDMERNPAQYTVEKITAPVLIIQAKDDPMAVFPPVEAMAKRITGSELVAFDKGGHVLYNNGSAVKAAVGKFLAGLSM